MTGGRYTELIDRLRYLDTYAQPEDRQEKTIYSQAADSIELLVKAIEALGELSVDHDKKIRGLETELRGERARVDFLTDEIDRLEEELDRLRKENVEMKKYIAEGAPGK